MNVSSGTFGGGLPDDCPNCKKKLNFEVMSQGWNANNKNKHPNCLGCGKELKPHLESKNFVTGEWDEHTFICECFPEDMLISIG